MAIRSSDIGLPNIRKREDMVLDSNTSLSTTYNSMNVNESNNEGFMGEVSMLGDTVGQGGVDPETPTPTPSLAKGAYGDLDFTKHLYESGLQNIFSDYQRNIQTLQQEQTQQLQQAYVVREMSKKYLGEYASNIGIGDVSGSLIDIYSQYASNISDIDQNFAALEMNLTREYTTQRMNTFEQLLRTEYQLEVAQLDDVATQVSQYVFTEFDNDVLGGLNYLESQQENMNARQYEAVRDSYYRSNVQSVMENINSDQPYYGFADLETRTMKTQEQYLEEAKRWMEPSDYRRLEENIALREMIGSFEGEIDFGQPILNFDPTTMSSDPNISPSSTVYRMANTLFAVSDVSILDDDVALDNRVDIQLLNRTFEEQSGKTAAQVVEGDIVQYQGFYIYQDNAWRRMINVGLDETTMDEEEEEQNESTTEEQNESTTANQQTNLDLQRQWGTNEFGGQSIGENYRINSVRNTFTLDGVEYKADERVEGRAIGGFSINDRFTQIHGAPIEGRFSKEGTVIKVGNDFYYRKGDKIWRMAKQ